MDRKSSEPTGDDHLTREQRRSRRKRTVRSRTINVRRLARRDLERGRRLYPEVDVERPRTFAECIDGPRPCPFVACKHHLYLDVSARTGAIKLNFPDLEPWHLSDSCSLDVAARGGTKLEDVGAIMNLSRERIRQIEVGALAKLLALDEMTTMRDYVDSGPGGKRRLPIVIDEDDADDEDEWLDADEDEADGA